MTSLIEVHPYQVVGSSTTSPVDNKTRKVVYVKSPPCWTKTLTKQIDVQASPKYWTRYVGSAKPHGSESYHDNRVKFRITVPLRGPAVTVELRMNLIHETDMRVRQAPSEEIIRFVKHTMNLAMSWWSEQFILDIVDPVCGKKSFPIHYKAVWLDQLGPNKFEDFIPAETTTPSTGTPPASLRTKNLPLVRPSPPEDITVVAYDDILFPNFNGMLLHVDCRPSKRYDVVDLYVHELGHCFGLPDEYRYRSETGGSQLIYRKADGTTTKPMDTRFISGNRMVEADARRLREEHAWNVAIEVAELLTDNLRPNIACNVRYVGTGK